MKKITIAIGLILGSGSVYASNVVTDFFAGQNLPTLETIVLSLVLLILCYFLLMSLIRRISAFKLRTKSGIKVLETLPLSSKEKLYLLKVKHTNVLVGVSGNKIQPIHAFTEPGEERMPSKTQAMRKPPQSTMQAIKN